MRPNVGGELAHLRAGELRSEARRAGLRRRAARRRNASSSRRGMQTPDPRHDRWRAWRVVEPDAEFLRR
jgi:hypothetical protein